jgi:cyclophilin family peptidyl-prolyl cis-trans isomerase/outer membrane protein OmpA-like peptidoglycan-associated protein
MYRSLIVACALWSLAPRASAQPAPPPAPAAPAAELPTIEVTQTRVEINRAPSIQTDQLFEPGDTAIKPTARPLLDAIAKALAKDPTTSVRIGCYTDDTAPDNDRTGGYNQKLSQARAEAVLAYLGKHGVAARRLSAKGYGRDRPIADNAGDDGRRVNRRLELAIAGEVRPPDASDLATYTRAIKGKGALIATIATNLGTLHCQLFDDKAPIAVANFIGLATGQKPWTEPQTGKTMRNKPFYDGLVFHRVIPRFMIQGGDPLANGTGGPGYKFEDEIVAELSHKPGTLAMANAGPSTNGSQFFIDEVEAPWLERRHTVFGQCKELDVITKIASVPRGAADKPTAPVMISHVTIGRGAPVVADTGER